MGGIYSRSGVRDSPSREAASPALNGFPDAGKMGIYSTIQESKRLLRAWCHLHGTGTGNLVRLWRRDMVCLSFDEVLSLPHF
jgi:hypothetical protein